MFRIILSLGEGIKVTAHVAIFSPSQHAWLVLMHPGGMMKISECKQNMLFCRIMKEG